MFASVMLAVLLASGSLICDSALVKVILLLLAIVVLMGGTARGEHE